MNLKQDSIIQIYGSNGSGKSSLLRHIIELLAKNAMFDYGIYFCGSAGGGLDDLSFFPEEYIHPVYDEKVLKALLKKQLKGGRNGKHALVVFDDCLGTMNFNSKLMQRFLSQNRHFRCTIILVSQQISKIPPQYRECASYVALYEESSMNELKCSYENFGVRSFPRIRNWIEFLEDNTGDYAFVWVDHSSKKKLSLAEKYKSLRAPDPKTVKPFQIIF